MLGHLHTQHHRQLNSAWMEGLKHELKLYNSQKTGINLHYLGLANGFSGKTPKAYTTRKKRYTGLIKVKNFCPSKNIIKILKR